MPLQALASEPVYMTAEEQSRLQEATPSSFSGHAPVLRLKLDRVRCCVTPRPAFQIGQSSRSGQNGDQTHYEVADGTLWVTDDQIAFMSSSNTGFSLDYPSLSLHAISRYFPDFLNEESASSSIEAPSASSSSLDPAGCVYCQLEGSEGEEEEPIFPELWILPAEQESLESLFEALSYCASLHPSFTGDEDEGGGHPFAGVGPFGTGLMSEQEHQQAVADGAFDDAEEQDGSNGGQIRLSDTGRATLAHLDSLLGEDDSHKSPALSTRSVPASFHSSDPRRLDWTQSQASNSLILVHLPDEIFTHPSLAGSLLDLLHAFGDLASWNPLPSFHRALIVYEQVEGARRAKEALDRLLLPLVDEGARSEISSDDDARIENLKASEGDKAAALRAFYGPMTSVKEPGEEVDEHLTVPTTDRNFLISPPGSPPVGWEPIREDPPNRETLADDLIRALGSLRDRGLGVHSHQPEVLDEVDKKQGSALPPPALVIPPSEATVQHLHPLAGGDHRGGYTTISVPGVVVQSMDAGDDRDEALDSRLNRGMSISSVKATVDSMKGPYTPASKISPTSRPPLA